MQHPFKIKEIDREIYKNELKDFLPDRIIDIHTHIWLNSLSGDDSRDNTRLVSWPSLVAPENSVEDHLESYNLLFPDKKVTPMVFASLITRENYVRLNNYVSQSAKKYNLPALYFAFPEMGKEELEKNIISGGFLGIKVYLSLAPNYLPADEIRIYDYLPPHQLELLNEHGWIAMLHIPRSTRLKDRVNLAQMMEIDEKYPDLKLIIAHVGRAYCREDVGDAFDILSKSKRMYVDFSANTNDWVFEGLIKAIGPKRILFGSDMPILRMRMKRICEEGKYINIVPKGLYGDVSKDSHIRETKGEEAEKLTTFMYEELRAFKRAAARTGLKDSNIEDIFYNNSKGIIDAASGS